MEEGSEPCPPLEGLAETQADDDHVFGGRLVEGSEGPMIEGTDEMDAQLMRMLQEGTQASQDDLLLSNITFLDSQADKAGGTGQHASQARAHGQDLACPASLTTVEQPGRHASRAIDSAAGKAAVSSSPPAGRAGPLKPQPHAGMDDMGMDIDEDMLQDAYMHASEMQEFMDAMQDELHADLIPEQFDLDLAANPSQTKSAGAMMPPPLRRPPGQQQAVRSSSAASIQQAAGAHAGSSMLQQQASGAAPTAAMAQHQAAAIEAHVAALFDGDSDADVNDDMQPLHVTMDEQPDICQPPRLLACDISGECMPVTSTSGLRVYCAAPAAQDDTRRLQWQDVPHPPAGRPDAARRPVRRPGQTGHVNLLSRPISELMRDAQQAQLQAALEQSCQMAADAADGHGVTATTPARSKVMGSPPGQQGSSSQHGGELLWVSKHAPRKFMSLLSDEQTNRQVAKWVKAWDAVVFGLPQQHQQQQSAAGSRYSGGAMRTSAGAGAGNTAGGKPQRLGVDQLDTRPEKKVILLCGPPGAGKTTLAHVVAQHCGYHPFEINASDDRTADTLTRRVTDAVQMQPVLGERKPNCVIIDEIDGATGGAEGHSAIAALLNIINAGSKPAGEKGNKKASSKKTGRKGKSLPPLSRPIICIANDLYAPALRPLRDVAQVFHFKAPDLDKLVSRLLHICNQEGVNVDKPALVSLGQRCDCDIRTCLNTLQFLAKQHGARSKQQGITPGRPPAPVPPVTPGARTPAAASAASALALSPAPAGSRRAGRNGMASPPPHNSAGGRGVIQPTTPAARTPRRPAKITLQQIEQLPIGSKDTSKGIFSVWDAMLHLPRQAGAGAGGSRHWRRSVMNDVHKLLQDVGEYELTMAGVQENLLSVQYLDVHLKNTAQMMDALADADILLNSCRRRVDFSMLSYVPARLLLIHLYAAQHEKPPLQWPKALPECSRRATAHRELLQSWAGYKVAGRVLQAHHVHNLSLELLPALLHLLSPAVRPLAPNLLNPAEQQCMHSCVRAMVDYGLRFALDEDARPGMRVQHATGQMPRPVPLDPALDCMHAYNSYRSLRGSNALRSVPLVLRQMLNQQATLEGIRRTQANTVDDEDINVPDPVALAKASAVGRMLGVQSEPSAPAGKQPLAVQDSNTRVDSKALPGAVAQAKPAHWLDAMRLNATNKRKAHAASARQSNKRQATDDGSTVLECSSPTGKVQFPVLYRYNEGYTNAVKRPLLMKELL